MNYIFLLLWLLLPQAARALAPTSPLQIAQRFVAKQRWPQMKEYLCCEAAEQAKQQTLGQQIPPHLQRKCALLQQDAATAVVAVELRNDTTSTSDFYLHFTRAGDAWKLQAVRGLSMTALGHQMLKLMEEMPPAEAARYDQSHPDAGRDFTIGNIRLWIGADADIIDHFQRHQAEFNEVVRLAQAGRYFPAATPAPETELANEQAANDDPAIKTALQALFIRRLTRRTTACGSCLEFYIGGVSDNTVGLLFQPEADEVPNMDPGRIIVIKPLGNGWYLYKTT